MQNYNDNVDNGSGWNRVHDNDNDSDDDDEDNDYNDDENDDDDNGDNVRSGCNRVHEWNPIFAAVINHKPSLSGRGWR